MVLSVIIKLYSILLSQSEKIESKICISLHICMQVFRYTHRGQNSKQIIIAKYVSKFLIYDAKMLDKYVKSQKKVFVHCPFLQSQAK